MKTILLPVLVVLSFVITAKAQQPSIERYVVASSGGTYFNGSNLVVDFTIGEVAVLSLNNANNTLTQGFQQQCESGVSINDLEKGMNISYYPNPVTSELTLIVNNDETHAFKIEIIDLLGQLITAQSGIANIDGTTAFNFDMQNLAPGNYFLHISNGVDFVKTIKIMKIGN